MRPTYELLLRLAGGSGAVVERLGDAERQVLAISTPVTKFIADAAAGSSPKHVVLTGSAGDGKTFAALAAEASTREFLVIPDASAIPSTTEALAGLVERLRSGLRSGKRMLVAINRGQLERLAAKADLGRDAMVFDFVREIGEGARLHEKWASQPRQVAVVDMGLVQWTRSVEPLLDRAVGVDLAGITGAARIAAERACDALRERHVRAWVHAVVRTVQAEGRRLTMRQLWSLVSYLVTGAIDPEDTTRPLAVSDTVGARLFTYAAGGTPLEGVLRIHDPALNPRPDLARLLLAGDARKQLAALPGVGALADTIRPQDGLAAARTAAVHDPRSYPPQAGQDHFAVVAEQLFRKEPGWHPHPRYAKTLLRGIYRSLQLWAEEPTFPAWQRLCYDATLTPRSGAVAQGNVNLSALKFGLPRPPDWCIDALGGSFRPPYLRLAAEINGSPIWVRLSPRLFNALCLPDAREAIHPGEALILARWLARLPVERDDDQEVRVMRVGDRARTLRITRDDASAVTRVEE